MILCCLLFCIFFAAHGKEIILQDEIQQTQVHQAGLADDQEMNAEQNTQRSFGSFISLGAPTQQTQAGKCFIDDVDIGIFSQLTLQTYIIFFFPQPLFMGLFDV